MQGAVTVAGSTGDGVTFRSLIKVERYGRGIFVHCYRFLADVIYCLLVIDLEALVLHWEGLHVSGFIGGRWGVRCEFEEIRSM